MQTHDIYRLILKELGPTTLFHIYNKSTSLFYKWAESKTYGSGVNNPLDRMTMLFDALKEDGHDVVIEDIGRVLFEPHGYELVRKSENREVSEHEEMISRMWTRFSTLLLGLSHALDTTVVANRQPAEPAELAREVHAFRQELARIEAMID